MESGRIAPRAVAAERIERRVTREYTIVFVYEGNDMSNEASLKLYDVRGDLGTSGLLTHSTDVTKAADPDIAFLFLPAVDRGDLIRQFFTILTSLLLQISFLFPLLFL